MPSIVYLHFHTVQFDTCNRYNFEAGFKSIYNLMLSPKLKERIGSKHLYLSRLVFLPYRSHLLQAHMNVLLPPSCLNQRLAIINYFLGNGWLHDHHPHLAQIFPLHQLMVTNLGNESFRIPFVTTCPGHQAIRSTTTLSGCPTKLS